MEHYRALGLPQVSLNHFAPHIRRYAMVLCFKVRALYFKQTVETIRDTETLRRRMDDRVRRWFETFPVHDGFLDALLLGKFLGSNGVVPLQRRVWFEDDDTQGTTSRDHAWLRVEPFGLDIDVTFGQFPGEARCERIFFAQDRHPFQTGEADTIVRSVAATGLVVHPTGQMVNEDALPDDMRELHEKLYAAILPHIPADCPAIDEIGRLYRETMQPIQALNVAEE